nr:LrgB family protein [Agrobacterium tumefaciens]
MFASRLSSIYPSNPLLNPTLLAVTILVVILRVSGIDYATYFSGGQLIHFLLGPATVALGIPLTENLALVRRNLLPIGCALLAGCAAAVSSTIWIGELLGLPHGLIASLAPKSATAPVAMAVSAGTGGDAGLTATFVVLTGMCGAILARPIVRAMRSKDASGFAIGLASHGIGTARAYSIDPIVGVFSGIAMALNAILTPLIVKLLT